MQSKSLLEEELTGCKAQYRSFRSARGSEEQDSARRDANTSADEERC